ncbi:hypothetical protein B1R32_1011 [Abditibacterium utsteinense]|uniref:Uncharacterized protein n=1 Tax=Abditibacterium utsteinense TaxID=1960156 RepID=A0A2S8SWW4_9BACT|nr:hypothetical protein [Abditibacterium utsteinense]PQV65264.1 hypothetical protein B1R32_1011 [Abditibacterium utsteinense]
MSLLETKPTWKELAKESPVKRRHLLREMISLIPIANTDFLPDPWGKSIVFAEDIDWLLETLESVEANTTAPKERADYVTLLLQVAASEFRHDIELYLDALNPVIEAWRAHFDSGLKSSALERRFDWTLRPVDLISPEAEALRRQWQQNSLHAQEMDERKTKAKKENPAPLIESQLADSESEKPYAWNAIVHNLAFDADGHHQHVEHRNRPLELVGWIGASDETRGRVVESVKRFLIHVEPKKFEILHRRWNYRHENAAFKGLCLLYDLEDYDFIEALSPELWEKWAIAIVKADDSSGIYESVRRRFFLHLAYKHAPKAIVHALVMAQRAMTDEL